MKKTVIIGIVFSAVLFVTGLFFPLPEKYIYISPYSKKTSWTGNGVEYVGGDSYSYQVEGSLRAGWVSGVMALKAIFISSGVILFSVTLMYNSKMEEIREQTHYLKKMSEK